MTPNLTDPPVIILLSVLIAAISAFFFEKVHGTAGCNRRRNEDLQFYQQRIDELTEENKELKNMVYKLLGVFEETVPRVLPAALRKQKE